MDPLQHRLIGRPSTSILASIPPSHPSRLRSLESSCILARRSQRSRVQFAYHHRQDTQEDPIDRNGVPHTGLDALAQSRCHDRGVCCMRVCVSPTAPQRRGFPELGSRSLLPTFSVQEYDKCYNLIRECSPHARITYECTSIESFRESICPLVHVIPLLTQLRTPGQIISQMLPLLMMRHRRISRTKWKDCETPNGKHWIEQVCPSNRLASHPVTHENAHHPLFFSPSLFSRCHSPPTTCHQKSFSNP